MTHEEQVMSELLNDLSVALDKYWANIREETRPEYRTDPRYSGAPRIISGPRHLNHFLLAHIAKVLRPRSLHRELPTTLKHFMTEVFR